MTKFYFVRHGMTEYNLQNRFQGGRVDSPLLPESLVNASTVGKHLAEIDFAKVYASSQPRAYQTAKQIVAQFDKQQDIIPLNSFVEYDFGTWDGKLLSDYQQTAAFKEMIHDPKNFNAPEVYGGEHYQDFVKRGQETLKKIFDDNQKDDNILIVAHSLIISFTVKTLLGVDLNEVRRQGLLDNTSVTVLETNDFCDFNLLVWNDTFF